MEQLIHQSTKRYRFWFILSAVVVVALGLLCRFHIIPSLSLFADKISVRIGLPVTTHFSFAFINLRNFSI